MIIDKEDNLDLNSTSYKSQHIKALSRKLVYSKDVSAEPIGFLCFLVPVLIALILSTIRILFNVTIPSEVNTVLTLILGPLILAYVFMKSVQVMQTTKANIKYIFNTNVFIIFLIGIILFTGIVYFLYHPISHMLMSLMGSTSMVNNFSSSFHNTGDFINSSIHFLFLLIIKEFIKNVVLYFIGIILFLIIFNVLAFPAYICASKEITLLSALKEGLKLSFKNMFKLLKIEFSFIHIIFFTVWIHLIFVWKGLYFFTSISLVIEKSLQDSHI